MGVGFDAVTAQQPTNDVSAIAKELAPLDLWLPYVSPDGPRPMSMAGSSLMGDDNATDPYYLSHAAWGGISSAVDHLNTLKTMIMDAKVLHIYSPFTIIRAAIENASTAVWLLAPTSRDERVLRRLRLADADFVNMEKLADLLGATPVRTLDQKRDKLRKIAAKRKIAEDLFIKKRPGYEEIVGLAGDATAVSGKVGKVVWKSGSAVAHGDMSTVLALLERSTLGQTRNIVSASAEAPVETLALMTSISVAIADKAITLYDSRRQPAY
jgi:hypothetical protein